VKTGLPVENVFEKFEDIKGVIISLWSKTDRKHNGQKKRDKRTYDDLYHRKLKIEPHEPYLLLVT
jgi:hypothetical protein